MQENISEKSGFVRLALGTGLTAFGVAHLTKDSGSKTLGSALVLAGAMKVAEGIFLYCPMKALIGSNVKEAVYNSFDEYMDGDSLMRAYNDTYQGRWGSTSSNTSKSNHSWSDSGLAKVATQAMQSVMEGEDPEQVINQAASSVNGSQSSNTSSSSKQTGTAQNFANAASEVMQSVANGSDPAEAVSKAASQMTNNNNGGPSKSASNSKK
ncbi:hypothetical protein SAMN05880501_102125 [Ureibacillus xyleni]|uniref:Inner membrane protein YgaP-like transmembrane domain-containing protein n=1 Tax=Ureibacillus xyleni TaxID=614648 RepID=A0A285S250_9BACL|nr:DUF2892 domain-containing protein [Ureibacillus xyleni]SOB98934.1 hypothetical protein SAMN05880501_102125 [Ureibacillus xyleni]